MIETAVAAAARQRAPVEVRKTHISRIRDGDPVFHDGYVRTASVGYSTFMGHTLFGDSYRLGTVPVLAIHWPCIGEPMTENYDLIRTEAKNWKVGDFVKLDGVDRKILTHTVRQGIVEITVEGDRRVGSIPQNHKATIGRTDDRLV